MVQGLRDQVFAGNRLHGDDMPVSVLELGKGSTKTGRLWAYGRYGRPYGDEMPPAVCYFYILTDAATVMGLLPVWFDGERYERATFRGDGEMRIIQPIFAGGRLYG